MKKILLIIGLLTQYHAAMANCPYTNVNWKMHVTNKTPDTLVFTGSSCSGTILGGATGALSGTTVGRCNAAGGDQCTYTDEANGHTGTLMLSYSSCNYKNTNPVNASASVSTNTKFPKPFACHQPPTSNYKGQQSQGGKPCPTGSGAPLSYPLYSVDSYFTVSQSTDYTLVWKNVLTNLAKGQVMANKLAINLMSTGDYINATAGYNGSEVIITLSTSPDDPYTDETSCIIT